MSGTGVNKKFVPKDPENGDFRFENIHLDEDSFDPDDWPADPSAYRPSMHFREYYRQYDRFLTGEIINEAITGGNLVPSFNDTAAFYTTRPGLVYYIVVGWDNSSPEDSDDRIVVTGWPHIYDREKAKNDGRFSTYALNEIQRINGTLFNSGTADDEWLGYFDDSVQNNYQ